MSTIYDFPKRLKALREAIGLSQTDFAAAFGISRASVSYYENGSRVPDIQFLQELYEKTGCSIEYLLGYADNMKPSNEFLGMRTGLTDEAISALDRLGEGDKKRIVNDIISHPLFSEFIKTIEVIIKFPSDPNRALYMTPSEYAYFKAIGILKCIVSASEIPQLGVVGEIWQYDVQLEMAGFDIETGKLVDSLEETMGSIKLSREKDDREFLAYEAEQDELAKTNPLLRFYRKMVKIRPEDSQSKEDSNAYQEK